MTAYPDTKLKEMLCPPCKAYQKESGDVFECPKDGWAYCLKDILEDYWIAVSDGGCLP